MDLPWWQMSEGCHSGKRKLSESRASTLLRGMLFGFPVSTSAVWPGFAVQAGQPSKQTKGETKRDLSELPHTFFRAVLKQPAFFS